MANWAIWTIIITIGGSGIYLCWYLMSFIFREHTIQVIYDSLHTSERLFAALGLAGLPTGLVLRFLPNNYTFYTLAENCQRVFLYLGWIFFIGSIVQLIQFIFNLIKVNRMLRETIPISEEIQRRYDALCEEMEIHKAPRLVASTLTPAPFLAGVLRPIVCVSLQDLEQKNWRSILTHELFHFKNHDLWYRGFLQITTILFWYDPLFYLWKRQAVQIEEQYCDYSTVERYWVDKHDYQMTLVETARQCGSLMESGANLSFAGKELKARILRMDRNYRIGTGKRMALRLAFLFISASSGLWGMLSVASRIDQINRTQLFLEEGSQGGFSYAGTEQPLKKTSVCSASRLIVRSGDTWNSGQFYLRSEEQYLTLAEFIDHPGSMARIGIVSPDGKKHYIVPDRSWDSFQFPIEENGWYQIHIENRSSSQVCINFMVAK